MPALSRAARAEVTPLIIVGVMIGAHLMQCGLYYLLRHRLQRTGDAMWERKRAEDERARRAS